MSIDFQKISAAALAQAEGLVVELFPAAKRDGIELRIGSLAGEAGKSLAINMRTGAWKDFATGDCGGDLISLWAARHGVKQNEAAIALDSRLRAGGITGKAAAMPNTRSNVALSEWDQQPFAPTFAEVPAPAIKRIFKQDEWREYPIAASWQYRDEQHRLVGYICRVNFKDGTKDIFPFTYCKNDADRFEWRWRAFCRPRPLYRLPELLAKPEATILIVEGEKTADAAARLLPNTCVTTWAGGSMAVETANLSPLNGRRVFLWPDADSQLWQEGEPDLAKHAGAVAGGIKPLTMQPGFAAMVAVADKLEGHAKSVFILHPPEDWMNGYDLADAERDGWTTERVKHHVERRKNEAEKAAAAARIKPDIRDAVEQMPARSNEGGGAHDDNPDVITPDLPFRCLGYNNGKFYYLPQRARQIVELSANDHKQLPLLQLAPLHWWSAIFAGKDGADFRAAANALMAWQYREPVFSVARLRGRGAWIDGNSVVFHAGDRLIINGDESAIGDYQSKFIYEQGRPIKHDSSAPATAHEASKFIELCRSLPFKHKLDSTLLAGWCVVAPICGAMGWRPHIWVSGAKGTGKTWCLSNIITPMLGDNILKVQSATTEAGIRQSLHADALPVVFDEAESEDRRGQFRMQSILELARQSSSETGAGIIKGTTSGRAMEFTIRSCFCFASIGVAAMQAADVSRITSLELRKMPAEIAEESFADLKKLWSQVIGQEGFASRVRARSLSLARVIRNNAPVFALAIAQRLGDQRLGDQLGALVSGAFSLSSSKPVTSDQARDWVTKQDWSAFAPQDTDADESQAFNALVGAHIKVEGNCVESLGELVCAAKAIATSDKDRYVAIATLLRHGVKFDGDTVAVANRHAAIRRIYADTPWADKWRDQLARVPGAKPSGKAVRFGSVVDRAIILPIEAFIG